MQIQLQANQTEILIAVGSVVMNLMGFVYGAAKISIKLSTLAASNAKLWSKMDIIERQIQDISLKVEVLWDRSNRHD
jgi:hypothetical protein